VPRRFPAYELSGDPGGPVPAEADDGIPDLEDPGVEEREKIEKKIRRGKHNGANLIWWMIWLGALLCCLIVMKSSEKTATDEQKSDMPTTHSLVYSKSTNMPPSEEKENKANTFVVTWDLLEDMIGKHGHLRDVKGSYRTPEMAEAYRRRKGVVLEKYATMSDEIKERILGCDVKLDDNGKMTAINATRERDFAIMENEFPYNLESGMKQLVFWSHNTQRSIDEIRSELIREIGDYDYLIWENKPLHRSVPDVFHAHCIYRT